MSPREGTGAQPHGAVYGAPARPGERPPAPPGPATDRTPPAPSRPSPGPQEPVSVAAGRIPAASTGAATMVEPRTAPVDTAPPAPPAAPPPAPARPLPSPEEYEYEEGTRGRRRPVRRDGPRPERQRRPKRRDRRAELLDGAVAMSTHRSDLGAKAARAVLWLVLALMVVIVLGLVLQQGRAAGPAQDEASAPSGSGAGGFAAVFMQHWLPAGQNSEQDLAPYMSAVPSLTNEPNRRFASQTPVVLSTTQVAPGYWSVLLAVDEVVKGKGGKLQPAGTHWYRVSVAQAGAAGATPGTNDTTVWQVTGPPFEVPAPAAGTPLTTSAYTDTAVPVSGPIGDTGQQFLDAYLTGQGELDRYTSPGVTLSPVTPATATGVQVTSIDAVPVAGDVQDSTDAPPDAVTVRVLVHTMVTSKDKLVTPMDFPLTLKSRAGRWEVQSLDAAPATAGRSAAPSSSAPGTGGSTPTSTGP